MTVFDGKSVLVTGAGQGIGYGICAAFANAGARVALNDYDGALAEKAAAQINEDVGAERVTAFPFDVADIAAIRAAVAQFGAVDIAVANAGITDFGEFMEMEQEQFDRIINVNLRGTYFTAQAAAKQMIAQGSGGRIVMMSSVVGMRAFSDLTAYGITKAGIAHMALMLAQVLGKHHITVNAIAPGAILTERTAQETDTYAEDWARVNPNKRVGRVDDIVNTTLFLASEGAGHITGQTLTVDGGWAGVGLTPEDYQPDDA